MSRTADSLGGGNNRSGVLDFALCRGGLRYAPIAIETDLMRSISSRLQIARLIGDHQGS